MGKGVAQRVPLPPQRWGVCSQQGAGVGMRACDHVTLQGKRSPTDSGIPPHCGSGCCPSPATPSRLHCCKLTHGFADTTYTCPAIREGSTRPSSTADWQDSATQGQKGVWDWGKGEEEEWVPSRAQAWSCSRCILQGSLLLCEEKVPLLCLGTALPTHSSLRVYLPPGCCRVDPLGVVPLC